MEFYAIASFMKPACLQHPALIAKVWVRWMSFNSFPFQGIAVPDFSYIYHTFINLLS